MLDDANVLRQRDPAGALAVAAGQYAQAEFEVDIWNEDNDQRTILNVVVAGMGGSALAALLVKAWLKADIKVPFEVLRSYDRSSRRIRKSKKSLLMHEPSHK